MNGPNAALKMPPPSTVAADVEARVRDFIANNFYVSDPADLEADVPLVERGLVDSTGILEVVSFLETEFGVKIGDEEMTPENLGSIGRIAAFVARRRGA